ncbi:hypothetical protein BCR36DRAFT_580674 [Piromyces finnis]|uniref:N-acetyltransferase domain-containing protein n=1 Tax=Piromyces finnis TaxID=1754191 RepID=A0A1Y1VIM2_9FUNG|nr:hypothetical protein BCR36DRAFT_580674 [Piromyces finnis]|eukprot:ORX57256.1 hypothetical protein BCR36DRAFT_580674 [Piromyces finnis]
MLNILDNKRRNNSTSAFISKQSSVVVLRKSKFKARIEKQITKEKIKNLDFAVNNIITDYHLSKRVNANQNFRPIQQNNSSYFPNLNVSSFPFENISFEFDASSNDTTTIISPSRKRRPQLYKSSNGFRLSFCNLTDKEKKDQRASIYRKRTKNMREKDFFSRRQMHRDNESLFDCLQKYYYENDENIKKSRNRNYFNSIDTIDSIFGNSNKSQLFTQANTSNTRLSKRYIYNYFDVNYERRRRRRRKNQYDKLKNIYSLNRYKDDDSDDDADLDSDIDDNETIRNKNNIINFNFNNNQNVKNFSFRSNSNTFEPDKELNAQDRRRKQMLMKRRQQYKSRSSFSLQKRNNNEDDQMNNPNLTHIICDECCRKIKHHELYYSNSKNPVDGIKDDNWVQKLNKINGENSIMSDKPLICEYCRCIKDKALCSISLTTDFSQKVIFSRRTKKRYSLYLTSNYNITSKAYNPTLSSILSSKAKRIQQYLNRTRISRKVQVWSRRKLFLMGLSNERQNLGNLLNITESYNDDLSFDIDQSLKITDTSMLSSILVPRIENPFQIVTLQSEIELENNSDLLFLFNQANELVKTEFSAKDMCVHLDSSLDEGLTLDIIVKEKVRTSSKLYCECHKHDDSESAKNFLKSNSFQFSSDYNYDYNKNNYNEYQSNNDASFMSYQDQSSSSILIDDDSQDMTEVDLKYCSENNSWLHISNSKNNNDFDSLDSSTTLIDSTDSDNRQYMHPHPHRRILLFNDNDNVNFEKGEEDERCVYCHKLKYNRKNYIKYEGRVNESIDNLNGEFNALTSKKNRSFSPKNVEVVAVMEYVFMKRYMWLEVIAVKQEYKGLGIGKLLMNRMSSIANAKDKDILLYSLDDVISFYKQFDFEFSPKFPHKSYHDGWFMTKRCKIPKNIFIPS